MTDKMYEESQESWNVVESTTGRIAELVDEYYEKQPEQIPPDLRGFLLLLKRVQESGENLQQKHVDEAIAEIERKLSLQTDEVLHHENFQEMESAWRSLRLLVENTDFREGIKIHILDASKEELVRDFKENPDITRSGYYRHVYSDGLGQYGGEPVGAVIASYDFGPSQYDIKLLRNVAAVASMAHAPFIAGTKPEMFDLSSYEALPKQGDLAEKIELPSLAAWRGFRSEPDARYIGLTMPRYLARSVYTSEEVSSFNYSEDVSQSHEHFLWGNVAFCSAMTLTRAFAKNRWCANITGPNYGGGVPRLPVHVIKEDGLEEIQIPTEIKISERKGRELSDGGFISLVWKDQTDFAAFFSVPSAKARKKFPKTPEGEADATNDYLGTQLPYMFIICRLAHYIKALQLENAGKPISGPELKKDLQGWINQYVNTIYDPPTLFEKPLRSAEITVEDMKGKPGWYEVDLQVTPWWTYAGANFTLSLVAKVQQKTG